MAKPTFDEVGDLRANNFDALRLILALAVLFVHSFANLSGIVDDYTEPVGWLTGGQTSSGELGVRFFFVISGFLICHSWLRSKGWLDFFRRRVLRIYPAFIVICLICLIVVGPVGSPSSSLYFSQINLLSFCLQVLTLSNLSIPNTFSPIDGALWTIKIEFECYILLAMLGMIGLFRRHAFVLTLSIFVILVNAFRAFLPEVLEPQFGRLEFVTYFFAGVGFYLAKQRIPFSRLLLVSSLLAIVIASILGQLW